MSYPISKGKVLENRTTLVWAFQDADTKTELNMQKTYWEKHLRRIEEEEAGVARKASDPDAGLTPQKLWVGSAPSFSVLRTLIEVSASSQVQDEGKS